MTEHDKKLMAASNKAAQIHLKICELRGSVNDLEEVSDRTKRAIDQDIEHYDWLACRLDNFARGVCDSITIAVKE